MTAYLTVEEASAILGERLNVDTWTSASYADKTKALKQSTQIVNKFRYIGDKLSITQSNEFPRQDGILPEDVKLACCLIALALLDNTNPEAEQARINVVQRSVSTIKTTYDRSFNPEYLRNGVPSSEAWGLLKQYMADSGSVRLNRVS